MFTVYSLADTSTVFGHPDVGMMVLSDEGGGKVTLSFAGDMSSHTVTANGYVVVNKLRARSGTVSLELPQNSNSDLFLQRWCNYIESAHVSRFALAALTVRDMATNKTYHCTGVTPQKKADRAYDSASSNVNYTLLAAEITEM